MLHEALALHQQNRLDEAEGLYRQLLVAQPGNSEAWYRLAFLYYQQQRGSDALAAVDKALEIDPAMADAHMLKGVLLQAAARREEARNAFETAASLSPAEPQSWYNLGLICRDLGDFPAAITAFDRVLALNPSMVEAWNGRGAAQQRLRRFADSLESYDRALALKPDSALAWSNRAGALWGLKRLADALAAYDKALELQPGHAQAWIFRAGVLDAMQRQKEALDSLDRALALAPDNQAALYARATILCESGRIAEGFALYLEIAGRVWGAKDFSAPTDPPHKQRHDREQRDYLAGQGVVSAQYHLAQGSRAAGRAVNPSPGAEEQWRQSNPKLVVIDDFLTSEALGQLQRYCWGSTVWQEVHAEGYLGATPDHGFCSPLLAQIAEELQQRFPKIFAGHGLRRIWAFKYDSSLGGINIHADQAAVNVNFWITPDDANLDPAHGGMEIWDAAAPLDWDVRQYNGDEAAARRFLADAQAKSQIVPYRANRVVIFDSDLFHKTDVIAFRPGYRNRRINITLLFGRRIADGG